MEDVMQLFQEYLPKWAEEKMQPMPTEEFPDRWTEAWKDFVNEVLTANYDERVEQYKAMNYKTKGMVRKEKIQKKREEEEKAVEQSANEPEKPLTEWERVQQYLNKDSN